ncbi:hypothetical protein [Nocardia sp. NBC_01327]|uniref:hypothetical protein n=1 Tax=Nocardia sp. NBC_01327 TaxID=2903593 RepID=UPI002E13EE35|nr:hypothetical protein OG326_29790 [Nocardia sp. NBC_01327]
MTQKAVHDHTGNSDRPLRWPDPSPLSSWWDTVMDLPHGDTVPKPGATGAHEL